MCLKSTVLYNIYKIILYVFFFVKKIFNEEKVQNILFNFVKEWRFLRIKIIMVHNEKY